MNLMGLQVSHRLLLCVALSISLCGCGKDNSPEARAKTGKSLIFQRGPYPVPLERYVAFPYGAELHASEVKITAKQMGLVGNVKTYVQTFRAYENDGSLSLTSITKAEFYPDGRVRASKSETADGRTSSIETYTYNPDKTISAISEVLPIIDKRYSVTFKYASGSLSRIAQFDGDVESASIDVILDAGRPREMVGKNAGAEQWRVVYDYGRDGSVSLTRFSKEDFAPEKETATFHMDNEGRPSVVEYLQPDALEPDQAYRNGKYTYEYLPNFMRHLHVAMNFPKLNDKCDLDVTFYYDGDEFAGQVNSTGFAFANSFGPPGCKTETTEKQITRDSIGNVTRDRQGIQKVEELGRTLERVKYDTSFVYSYY